MKYVFRVDSSLLIGTGHVMRCLTLAHALKNQSSQVFFISREHPGNIIHLIEQNGFEVFKLPYEAGYKETSDINPIPHSYWLGASQADDAMLCKGYIAAIKPDWLIVDHYAIDQVWHKMLRNFVNHILVIDDIADRRHDCDVLLDQNYGKLPADYAGLVNDATKLLLGTDYALLRPEFLQWRGYSLQRREHPEMKQILITMGGIDADNVTGKVLSCLAKHQFQEEVNIKVIMGSSAPWLSQVQQQVQNMPFPTEVEVNVTNMAQIMADSDLAFGAAGSTSWERCCLGLPTVTVVLADNQNVIANALQQEGAATVVNKNRLEELSLNLASISRNELLSMSNNGAKIVDGLGVKRVIQRITEH